MKAVMSIGNPLKGDDNIGNLIIDKLILKDMIKIKARNTPENFIEKLKGCDEIIILDALEFGGKVGEVNIFKLNEIKDIFSTTHNIPINILQKFLPNSEIKIIGIQPKNINFREGLSKELKEEFENIVKKVSKLLL
ncbi:MAG: hydrogenase maturation protease [Candidatus Aenigmatarchaeota archaeon]